MFQFRVLGSAVATQRVVFDGTGFMACNLGTEIITYTILGGGPYYNYSLMGPNPLFPIGESWGAEG